MSNALRSHASDFVSTQLQEAVKTYSDYDLSNRLTAFYTALIDCEHGEKCLVTYYEYDGASTRVTKTKEGLATWDSAWDI